MATEAKTGLEWAPSGALQADLIVNPILRRLAAVGGQPTVIDKDLATPPSHVAGAVYIVASSPTGAWVGHTGKIAYSDGTTWYFYTPSEGWEVYVLDEDVRYRHNGTTWVSVASGGGTTAGKHAVSIMAGSITPSVSGGCSALTATASAANQPDVITLDFDATTQEYAQFAIPMPKSWNEGTITAQFRWSHAATATNFGVVWNIQAVAVSDDDAIATAFGTAQQIADTGGTTGDLYVTSETPAITVGGTPATGDTVFFRVSRVTGDGSDTMAIDARLHSVVLFITTDADTDL
jgi:hypothetical protein